MSRPQHWATCRGMALRAQIEKLMPKSHSGLTTAALMCGHWFAWSVLQLPNGINTTWPPGYRTVHRQDTEKWGEAIWKVWGVLFHVKDFPLVSTEWQAWGWDEQLPVLGVGPSSPHLWVYLPARWFNGAPQQSLFILILTQLTQFNFLSFKSYGTECILYNTGPILCAVVKTNFKRTN